MPETDYTAATVRFVEDTYGQLPTTRNIALILHHGVPQWLYRPGTRIEDCAEEINDILDQLGGQGIQQWAGPEGPAHHRDF